MRRTIVGLFLVVLMGVGAFFVHFDHVFGQTSELKIGRSKLDDFLHYTGRFCHYYYGYFKDRHLEGNVVIEAKFVREFRDGASSISKTIVEMKANKAPVTTTVGRSSKIVGSALDDELKGRGLEFKGEAIRPSDWPKTVSDLGNIFEYRLSIISDIITSNKDVTVGRQELFNLQNHMHSLHQIATAFQVVDG